MFPLLGSRRRAPELFAGPYGEPEGHPGWEAGQFPEPATTRILPLYNRATWIGLIGMVKDRVDHFPTVCAWPSPGFDIPTKSKSRREHRPKGMNVLSLTTAPECLRMPRSMADLF